MRRRSAVMEDILVDTQLKDQLADKHEPEIQVAKKGKLFLKTVKVVAGGGKQQKNEGPPSDSWSWRKYGQKPIKGSPYPRGYYRCSTSKGCPAKKQVERCKTDASMLKITYTSMHNHSGPNSHSSQKVSSLAMCEEPKVEQSEQARCSADKEEIAAEYFHYLEAPHDATGHIDQDTFSLDMDSTHESLGVLFDEEPISLHTFRTSPKSESNEYDFFDELEDLPLSSLPFRSLMNSNFNGDRILVQPS